MSFKDYFSSDSWFNGAQGHVMNMALTDYNEKWGKLYIVWEWCLSGVDGFCGIIIWGISAPVGRVTNLILTSTGWLLNQTAGRLFNSASDDNDSGPALPKAKLPENTDTASGLNNKDPEISTSLNVQQEPIDNQDTTPTTINSLTPLEVGAEGLNQDEAVVGGDTTSDDVVA